MCALKKHDAIPSLNIFCSWCDFKDYCNTYKKAYEKNNYSFEAAEKYDDTVLINEWMRVRDTKKILETRESELAMFIMERIRKNGKKFLENGDTAIYIRNNKRVDFDVQTVYDNVPVKEFLNMVSLKKAQVEKYINKKPSIRETVLNKANHNFTAPFLASRKANKNIVGEV
jgi:hypothetical protein